MANKTSRIRWIIISLIVLLLLIVVFLSLTPAGSPRASVDYIAEYNRLNKPTDFDPNDNAAPYFDKAFELMVEEPNDIKALYKLWPGDMNDDQIKTAQKWIEVNKQTINYLKQAIAKSCYWKPLTTDTNQPLWNIEMPYLRLFRQSAYLLCMEAKLMAQEGQTKKAFEQLADVYKMGAFLTGPKFIVEQLVGKAISTSALQSTFQILEHTSPAPALLKNIHQRISELSSRQLIMIDFTIERWVFDDEAQRGFPSFRWEFSDWRYAFFNNPVGIIKMWWHMNPMGRYQPEKERAKADKIYEYLTAATHRTPWELHKEGNDVSNMIEEMTKNDLLLNVLIPAVPKYLLFSYHRVQVETDALIATTAILRYKADKGHLPQDLQTLVTDGFLDKLPMDPFSDGPLVYKLSDDNFVLYSVAQDFNDNGGKHDPKWADKGNSDFVFWPFQTAQTSAKTSD
jgi:hypothetical protein